MPESSRSLRWIRCCWDCLSRRILLAMEDAWYRKEAAEYE